MADIAASTRLIRKNQEYAEKHSLPTLREVFDRNMDLFKPLGFKHLSERFDPDWFRPARILKESQGGKYTRALFKSKAYMDFWKQELDRCKHGYTVKGYFCPGDLYYFLNYYTLPIIVKDPVTGAKDRILDHPDFWDVHYYWAYYTLAVSRGDNDGGVCLKPRGVGWSEYVASMGTNRYNHSKNSVTLYTAAILGYLSSDGIMTKVNRTLNWLNDNSQRGFKRIRMKKNSPLHSRASKLDKEGTEFGWMSEIIGKVINSPEKLRGIRTNFLVFEEAGSYKMLKKCVMTARALISIGGDRFGFMVVFGTGGDENANGEGLQGLRDIFTNPRAFDFLGLLSNYNESKVWREQGFFFAAYECAKRFMNGQGITDIQLAHEYYMAKRKRLEEAGAVQELIQEKAEYCFIPEEAFMRSGTNVFDRIRLSNQRIRIRHSPDRCLQAERGELEWVYKKGTRKITGVEWVPKPDGRIRIYEHPRKDKHGKVYKHLYIGGIDSIDQGVSNSLIGEKGSKFAALVKKRFLHAEDTHNMYVASYCERPHDERVAFEISLKIAVYFNLKWNVERTKKEIVSYYREKKMLMKYIVAQPSIISNDVSSGSGSEAPGTPINAAVIAHYISRIKQYVSDSCDVIFLEDVVEELLNYSDEQKTKFDLTAAMGMCELLDEDIEAQGFIPVSEQAINKELRPYGYYFDANGYKKFGAIPDGNENLRKTYQKLEMENPEEGDPEDVGIRFTDASDTSYMDIGMKELDLEFELA